MCNTTKPVLELKALKNHSNKNIVLYYSTHWFKNKVPKKDVNE